MSETEDDKYYNEHAEMMGHVSLAWNDCHSEVLQIFHTLSNMDWKSAQAIFLSLRSDQAQRRMTRALMDSVLVTENDQPLLELGRSLLKQLDDLAGERNAATHTMWVTLMPDRKIIPHPRIEKHGKLEEDFQAQFSRLTTQLRELFRQLLDFDAALQVHLEQRKTAKI
jgi:hypothetical protein